MSRLQHRRHQRQNNWSIVDKILPGNALHIVVGNSNVGKTTWLMQILYQWAHGEPVLGFESHPCPWVYVSLDRASWETDKLLIRVGLEHWDAPIFSIEEVTNTAYGYSLETILNHPHFNGIKLFVIEGLQGLIPSPGPRQSQNQAEMQWIIGIRQMLFASQRAIIAVTHPPKSKRTEVYASSRSETLGSQSIGACSGTMIHVNNVYDEADNKLDQRELSLDGKDFRQFSVLYDIDQKDGRFLNPQIGSSGKELKESERRASVNQDNLDMWLMARPLGPIRTAEMISWGESQGISRTTVFRWIQRALERKILVKLSIEGLYQKSIDPEGSTLLQ